MQYLRGWIHQIIWYAHLLTWKHQRMYFNLWMGVLRMLMRTSPQQCDDCLLKLDYRGMSSLGFSRDRVLATKVRIHSFLQTHGINVYLSHDNRWYWYVLRMEVKWINHSLLEMPARILSGSEWEQLQEIILETSKRTCVLLSYQRSDNTFDSYSVHPWMGELGGEDERRRISDADYKLQNLRHNRSISQSQTLCSVHAWIYQNEITNFMRCRTSFVCVRWWYHAYLSQLRAPWSILVWCNYSHMQIKEFNVRSCFESKSKCRHNSILLNERLHSRWNRLH